MELGSIALSFIARHSFLSVVKENGITNLMSVPAPTTFGQSEAQEERVYSLAVASGLGWPRPKLSNDSVKANIA